jgi:similar to stage IV sporulation protein
MLRRFGAWLSGNRRIRVSEEGFIVLANEMMRHDIRYVSLKAEEKYRSFTVTDKAYKRLCSLEAYRESSAECVCRRGLPYLIFRYRRRYGLVVGALLLLILTRLSTLYVWDVSVEGNRSISDAEVLDCLSELGFGVGSKISDTDFYGICHRLLLVNDGISWVSVNMEGTRAVVRLKERKTSDITDNNSPSNLVAETDGEIIRTETVSGQLEVKVGQTVRAGELLVSGVVEAGQGDSGRFVLVRSRARIFARTKRVIVAEIPLVSEEKVVVGRKNQKKSLIFFGKMLKLQENYSISGDNCDIIRVNRRIVLFENMSKALQIPLPIIISNEYLPVTETIRVTLTEEEALSRAEATVSQRILETMPEAELITRESYYEIAGDTLILTVTLECIEDIASETFIGVA